MAEPNLMSLNERLGMGHANKTSVTEVHYIELPITIRLVRCTHTGDVIAVSVAIAQITCWQRLIEAVFFERFRRLVVATRRKAYGLRGRLHHALRLKIAWNTHKNQRLQNIHHVICWYVQVITQVAEVYHTAYCGKNTKASRNSNKIHARKTLL